MRQFRFGMSLPELAPTKEWEDQVRRIEGAGFDVVACADHFTQGSVMEPTVALTWAAAATSRIKVLCQVYGNDYRHPVILHKSLAMMDVLSGGRLEVGIGAGWMITDYEAAGMTYDPPGVRVSRLEESVKVMKGLFAPGSFSFAGDHYQLAGLEGLPRPAQSPHPPVLIGGGGKRVLGIAAREADIVGINANLKDGAITAATAQDLSAARVDEKIGWVRDAAARAGRSVGPDGIEFQMSCFMVRVTATTDEADQFHASIAPMFGVEPALVAESPTVLAGTASQCIDKLCERRERFGISYWHLRGDVAELEPIVSELAGT